MFANLSTDNFSWDEIRSRLNQLVSKPAEPDLRRKERVGQEHFIPVRPVELIDELLRDCPLDWGEQQEFRTQLAQVEHDLHEEYRIRLRRLQDTYASVNPDLDIEPLRKSVVGDLERELTIESLFSQFSTLLERANFRQLSIDEVASAIGNASALGVCLDVDLTQFDRLAVFARGEIIVKLPRREWRNWWYRKVELEIPMYQRLVVIFRMNPDISGQATEDLEVRTAYIRLFKNVPQKDIDMVLPGGKIRISLLDRGKILVPTISGVGLATFKLGLLLFAGFYGLLKILGLLGGAIGGGWKSVNGYWKTKNKYELSLTRNLYYQNLDNNAGVLLRLAAEAEQQDLRETILSYFVVRTSNCELTTVELQRRAEHLLLELGVKADFEVNDALAKLLRFGLCRSSECGKWQTVQE